MVEMEVDNEAICIEDRLRLLGILSKEDDSASKSKLNSNIFKGVDLEVNIMPKKVCIYIYIYIICNFSFSVF